MPKRISRLDVFLIIFKNPVYILSTIISSAIFYYIFYILIAISNKGIFILLIPAYLIYLLMILSGILFSISLYSLLKSLLTKAARFEGEIASILLPSIGGLISSCGCSFSIFASLLGFLGVNAFESIGIVSTISTYQLWLIVALVVINVAMIYFYLGKLTRFFSKRK